MLAAAKQGGPVPPSYRPVTRRRAAVTLGGASSGAPIRGNENTIRLLNPLRSMFYTAPCRFLSPKDDMRGLLFAPTAPATDTPVQLQQLAAEDNKYEGIHPPLGPITECLNIKKKNKKNIRVIIQGE